MKFSCIKFTALCMEKNWDIVQIVKLSGVNKKYSE